MIWEEILWVRGDLEIKEFSWFIKFKVWRVVCSGNFKIFIYCISLRDQIERVHIFWFITQMSASFGFDWVKAWNQELDLSLLNVGGRDPAT